VAQEPATIDYECELVVVIGKKCKDVTEDKALDYVLGYCVGNDVSHREWQLKLGGGQWNYGKGFDGWAPVGPGLVKPSVLGSKDPAKNLEQGKGLKIWTKVNGEVVQEGWTGDMIFGVKKTISFLSQGTTLLPGSLIFMGT
jgi:2-keto-4-pentenoate hydratase/2-oxohepta-3-ene-1,7-dioic acid hydratase in catechol pathway